MMLLLTAVGPDQPGMAHAVAQVLFEAGCNIDDTTMTRLGGQFAMILLVALPASLTLEELATELNSLRSTHGLTIDLSPAPPAPAASGLAGERFMVSLYGPEAKGLVARATGVLAGLKVNITDVQTRVANEGTAYLMLLEVEAPRGLTGRQLEEALQATASQDGPQAIRAPD